MRPLLSIAIDGPGSAGKGTVAKGVAQRMSYQYIDTGAMYRCVALLSQRNGISWDDASSLAHLAERLQFCFRWEAGVLRVLVGGKDLTETIRTGEIGTGASSVSRHGPVRSALLQLQRDLGARGGVVMDGRDIGTVILPDADVKVYLDASIEIRAVRRYQELARRGSPLSLDDVRERLRQRDRQDMKREIAPLRVAPDAVIVDTSGLTILQSIDAVLALIERSVSPG